MRENKQVKKAAPEQGDVQDLTEKATGTNTKLEGTSDVLPTGLDEELDEDTDKFVLPKAVRTWKPASRTRACNPSLLNLGGLNSGMIMPMTKLVAVMVDAANTKELFSILRDGADCAIIPDIIPNRTQLFNVDDMLRTLIAGNESLSTLYTVTAGQCNNVEDLKRALRYLGPVLVESNENDGRHGEMVIYGVTITKTGKATFKAYVLDATGTIHAVAIDESKFGGAWLTVLHYKNPTVKD